MAAIASVPEREPGVVVAEFSDRLLAQEYAKFMGRDYTITAGVHYAWAVRRWQTVAPAHTGKSDCNCRACFFQIDRPRYWTSAANADSSEVTP